MICFFFLILKPPRCFFHQNDVSDNLPESFFHKIDQNSPAFWQEIWIPIEFKGGGGKGTGVFFFFLSFSPPPKKLGGGASKIGPLQIKTKKKIQLPSVKLTASLHLKIGGWKMNCLLGWPNFRGELLGSGRVKHNQGGGFIFVCP